MALKNIKRNSGFTIVELLIVIVVIAILATISIVAYNGIQNRAKSSAGQATANSIVKKLEAYNAINSAYPTTKTQIQGTDTSKIDGLADASTAGTKPIVTPASDSIISATALNSTSANGGTTVRINGTSAGGNVYYWDYAATTPAEVAVKYGP